MVWSVEKIKKSKNPKVARTKNRTIMLLTKCYQNIHGVIVKNQNSL